jgi:hypothetical protein
MKLSYGSVIVVIAIFAAVIVAGCTVTSPSGPTATATPGGPTATTAPAATTGTSGPSLDFNTLKVLEYKITSVANGQSTSMNLRWEYTPTDVHMKITSEGMTVSDITVPRDQASGTQGNGMLSDVTSPGFTTGLVSAGVESVTVPKGQFTCTKYTITAGNIIDTYWIAANVPLPIKMTQEQDGKLISRMELVDYQV